MDAIRERDASAALAPALANIVLHESENQVRARALNVLIDRLPSIPSLATTLEQVAHSEKNADMRNVARIALEKSSTRPCGSSGLLALA